MNQATWPTINSSSLSYQLLSSYMDNNCQKKKKSGKIGGGIKIDFFFFWVRLQVVLNFFLCSSSDSSSPMFIAVVNSNSLYLIWLPLSLQKYPHQNSTPFISLQFFTINRASTFHTLSENINAFPFQIASLSLNDG